MALPDVQTQEILPKKVETIEKHDFMPAAGPHDRPELTNFDACPGCGILPSQAETSGESDPGAG